jgi:hypothetical protein
MQTAARNSGSARLSLRSEGRPLDAAVRDISIFPASVHEPGGEKVPLKSDATLVLGLVRFQSEALFEKHSDRTIRLFRGI